MDGSEYGYTAQDGHTIAGHFATMRDYLNVGFPHELQPEDVADLMPHDIRYVEDIPPPLEMFQLNGVYSEDPSCVMNAGTTGPREPQFLGPTYDVRLDSSYALSETYLYYGNRYRIKSGRFPTPEQFFSADYTRFRNWMYPNPNLLFEPETDVVLQKMRLNAVYQESKQRYSSHPLLKYCSRTEMEANDQVIDDIDDDLFILHFQGCHVFGFHKFVIRNTYRCIVNIMTGSHFPADPFKGVAGWTLNIRQIYVYETAFTLHLCETLLSHPETIPKQILPVAYPMKPVVESESSGSSNATSRSDRSERSQEDEEEDEQQEEATQCTKTEEAADRFDAGHFGSYRPHTVQSQNMNEYPLPDNFLEDIPPKTSSTSRCSATNIEDEMRNATIEDREDNYHNKPESSGMEQVTNNDNKSVRSETDGETGDDDSEGESTDGSGDSDDTASASDGPEKPQEAEPVKFAIPEAPKRNWPSLYSRPRISAAAAPGGTLAFLAQRKAQTEAQRKQAAAANPLSSFFASRKSETEVQEKPAAEDGSLGLLASRKEQAEVEDTLAAASNSVQEVKNPSSRNEQQAQAAAKAAMYAAMMFPKRAGLEHKPRQYEHKPRQYVSVFQTMLNQKKEQAMAPQPEVVQLPPPVKRKVIHTVHDKPEEEDKKKPSDVPAWAMGLKSATARARKRAEDREGRKKDKANIKSFIGVFKVPGESPDQSRTASPAGSVGSGESPMDAYRRTSRKDGDPSNPTSRNQSPAVCSTTAPSRDSSSDSVRSSTRSSQLSRTPSRAASRERSNSFTTSPIPARLLPSPIAAKAKFLSLFEALRRTGQLRTAQAAPSVQEQQKPTESAPPSSSEALTQPQSIPEQRTVRRSNLAAMFAKQAEQKKNPTPVIVPEPVIKPLGKPEEQVQEATETHETQEPYTESHEEVESTNSGIVLQDTQKPEESEKHEDQPDFSQEYMDQPDTTMDWPESPESTDVWVQPEIVAKPTEKPQSSPKTSQQQRPQQRESVKTVSIPSSQSPVAQPGQKNTSPKQQQARVISYSPKSKTNAAVQGKSATVNQSFPPSVLAQSTPLPRETLDSYRRRMQLNGKPINMSTTMPTIIVASSASPDGRVPVYVPARSDKPVYYLIKKPQQPTVTRNPARPPSRSGAIPTLLKKAQQPVFPVVKSSHLVQQKSPVTGSDNPVVVGRTWGRKKVIMMTEEEMKRERAPIPASVARRHNIFRLPVDQQLPVFLPRQATNARGLVRQRKPSVPKPKQPRRPRARKLSPPRYNETDEHQSATYSFNQDTKEQDAQNSETTEKKKNYNPYIRQYPYTEHSYAELDTGIMRTLPARGRVHPHAVEMEGIVLDIPPEEDEPKVHDKATPTKTSDERQRSPTPPRIGPKRGRPFKGQEIPWTPAVSSKVEERKPRTRTRNNPDAPEVDTGIYITHERKPKTKRVKAELPAEECAKVQKNIEEAVPETTEPERAKKIVRPRGKKGTLMRKIATALEHQYYRLHKKKSPTNLERIPGSEMAGLLRKAVQYEVSRGEYSLLTRPLPHESRVQKRGRPEPRWIKGMKPILCHVVEKPSSLLAKKMTVDHFDVVVDELSPEEMSKFHKRLQKITVAYQEDLKLKEEIARLALSDDDSELEDEETFEELPSHLKSIVNEMGLREVIVPRIMAEVALLTTTNDTPQGITQCKEVVPEITEPVYEKPIVEAQPEVVPTEKEEQLNAPNPMGDFVKDLEKGGGNNASGPDGSPSTKESDEPEKRKRGRPKKVVKPRGRKAVLIKAGEWPLPEPELDKTAGELQKASVVDAQPEVAEPAEPKSKNIQEQPKRPRGRPKKEKKHLGRQKKQPEEAQISKDLSESVQPSTALSLESLLDDLQTSYHSDALDKNPEEEANVFVDEPAPPALNELAGSSYLSSILINTESEEEKIVHEQAEGTSAVAATEPEESADGPLVSYPPLEEPYAEPSYVFDDEVYTESFDNVDSFSANEPAQWETDDYSEGAVMNELLEQPENEQAVASVAEHVSDSDDDIQVIESEVTSAKENVVLKSPEVVCLDDSDDEDQQEEVENTPTTVNEELIVLDEITSPVSPQRLNEFRADVPAEVDEPHGNAESVDDEDVEDEKEFDELPVHLRKVVSDNFGTNLAEPGTLAESEPQRPDEVDDNAMPQLIASDAEQEDEEDFEDFPPELRKIFFSDTYVPKRKLRSYNLAEPRILAHSETQRPDEVADGVTAADEEPKKKLCPSNSAEPRNLAQPELQTPDEVENNVTSEGMAESSDEELEDEEEFEELPVHLRGEVAKHFATLRNSLVSQLVTESNLAEPGTLAENESERPDEVVNDFMPKVAAESDEALEDEEEFDELPAHLRKVVSENFGTMRAGLVSQLVTETNLAEPGTLVESELQTPDEVEDNVTSEGVAESSDEELEDEEEFEELPVHLRGEVAKHFAPLRNSLVSQLVTESNLAEPGTVTNFDNQKSEEVTEKEAEVADLSIIQKKALLNLESFNTMQRDLIPEIVANSTLAEPDTLFESEQPEEVADVTESQFVTEEAEHDVELEDEKEQSADEPQDAPVLAPVDSQLQASWGFEEEEEEEEEEVELPNEQNNHLFLEKETPKEQEKLPTSTKSAEEEKEEYQFDRAFNRVFGKMIKYMEETEREKIRPVVIESPDTTTVITQPIEEKTAAIVVREFVVCTAKAEIYAETLLDVGLEKTNVDFLKTEDVMFERVQRESAAATYHDTSAHATFTFAANEPTDNISFVYKMRPKAAAQISLEDHETSASFDFVKPSLDVDLCGTIPCKADPVKVAAKFGDARTSLDAIFTRDDANLEAEIWAGRSTEKTLLQIFDVETRLTREDQFRSCEGTMNIPNIESERLAVRGMTASFTAEDDRQYECSLDMKLPNYGEAEYLSVTTSTVAFESKPSSESVEYVQKLKNYEHQLPLAISDINISLVATPQTEHVEKRICLKNEAVASFTEGRFAFIKPDPPSFVSTLSLPLRVEEKLSFALVEVDLYNQKTDNMKTEHTFPLKSTGIPQSFLETTMYAELEKPEAEVYRTDEYVFYQKLQKWPVEETFTQPEYPKPSHTETAMNDEELDLLFGTSASTSHIQWPPEGSSALQQTEAPMKVFQDDLTVSAEQPDASPGLISPGVPRTPNFAVSSPSSVASFRPGPDEMMWDENPPSPIASGSNAFSVTPEDDVSRKGAKTSGAPLVANIDEAHSEKKHFRNLEKERRAEEKRKEEQQKEERRREKRLKEERLKEEQRKEERLKEEQRKEERMKEERRKEELRRAEKIKEEQRKEEQRKREQQEKLKQKWIKPMEMREERKREIHRRDDLKRAEARQRELREAEERRIRMEREKEAERIKKEKRALKLAKAASQKPTKMPIQSTHKFLVALAVNDAPITRKRKPAMQQLAEKPAKKAKLTEEVEEKPKKAKEAMKEKHHKHHKEKKESPVEKHKNRQVDEPVLEKPKHRHRHRENRESTSEKTPETDISTESISSITPPQERQKSPKRRHRHREKRGSTSEKTPETDISTESISTPPRELQKSPQRDQTSHVSPTPNQDSPTESKSTSPKMTMKLRLGVAIVNDKRHFFKLSPPIEEEESLPKIPSPKIQETEQPAKSCSIPLNVIVEPSEQMTEQSVKELPEIRNQDADELVKDPQTVMEKESVESVTQHQEVLETEADEAVTEDLRRHVGGEPSEIAPEASEEYQQLPENDEDRLETERCSNAIEAMNEDKNSDDEDEMNQTAHGFITARQQMQQEAAPEDVIDRFEPEIFSQSPEAEIQRNLSEPMHSFIEEHKQVQQDVAPEDVTFQSKPKHSSTAAEPETQSAFSGSAVRKEPPLVTISLENDELERLSDMQQKSLSDAIERKQDEDWAIFNQSEKKRKASEMETIEKRPRLEDPFSFCSLEENNRTISGLYDFREHDDSSLAIDIFQGSPLAEHSPLNLATDQFPSPLEEDPMDSFARMEEMEREDSEQASADLAATSATQMPEAFPTQETSCISNTDLQMSQPSTSTEGNDALSNLLIECNINKSSAVVAPKANAVEVPVQAEQPSRPTLDEHTTHELDSFFQKDMKNVPEVQSIEHAQNILSGSYEHSVAPNSLPQMQTTPPSAGSVPNHGSLPSNFQNVNMSLYDIRDPTFGSLPQLPPSEFDPVQNLGAMPTHMDQMNQGPNNWNIATEAQTTPMRPQMPLQTMMSHRAPAMTPMHPQGVPPQVQPIGVGTPALQQAAFLNANMPQRPGQQGLVQNQQRMHLQQQAAISQAQGLNMHPGPSSMQQNVMYQPIIQSQNLVNHNVGKIPTQTPLKQDTPTLPLSKSTPCSQFKEAAIQLQGLPFVASSIYPSPGSVQQHTSPNTMVTVSPQQQYKNPSLMIYNNDVGGANSSRVQTRSMANASASNTTVPNPYSKPHEWQNDLPELNLPHGNTQGDQFRQLPPTNANMQMYPGFTCNQPGSVPPNPPPHYQLQSQQMVYSNMPMPIRTQMQMGRPLAPPPYPYPHMQYSQQAPQEQWFFEQPMQQQQQSAQHSAQKMQMQTPSQHYQHQPQQQQQLQQQQLQQQQRQMQLQQQSQFAHYHAQQGYHQGDHHQYPSYALSAPMGRQLEQHWPINANPPCGSMAVNNPYLDVPKETQHQQVQEEVNHRNMQQWVDERNVNKVAPVVNNQNRNFMPPQNQDLHDIALQKQDVRPFEARLASFIQEIFYGVNMHNSQISVEQITKEISSIAQFSHQRCRRVHITAFNLSINLMEHHLSEMALPLMGNPEFANLPSRNDVLKKLNVTKQHKDGKKTLEWRSSDVYTTPADSLRYLSIGSESNIRRAFENARKQFEWLTLLQNSADKVTLIHVEIASQPRPSDPLKDGHPRQEILSCHDYFVQDVRIALHKSTFDCLRYGPIPMQERPVSSSGVEFNSGFADKAYFRPYNNDWSVLECFESGDLVASYLVWNPQLSYHLTHHVQNNTPFGNQDGSYDSNNQGHFGNDPSYDATFDGTFGLPPHPDNTGFSGSSYGNHGGYHGRRMNRLSSEDWNSLITINPEMTLLYPTIVLRCSFAIENVGSNSELLDSFMHTEQSILHMRTIFTNVVLQLKARREKTNQLIEAHKCFSQVWQSSWIVSMLELAKYLYSPTKCVTFQHVDYNILKATMKALYNSFTPAFSESNLENHLARAEESAKNLKAEVRDRHFSRMAFSMLDQIYIPKAMLQRLKTKPLWNAEARACSKSAYVSMGYNLTVPTSDLDNIFDREITSKDTSKTLHSYIESMGQFSRKASHRRALNTATNTTFFFEETFHSLKMYEEETRGVLRDLQSTPAFDPSIRNVNKRMLDTLPENVMKIMVARYIRQRCEYLTASVVSHGSHAVEMINTYLNKLSKRGITRTPQEVQLVLDSNPSNFGLKYRQLCVTEEIKVEKKETPMPARERTKRPASNATLPSIPAKSSRSEEHLTKPKTSIEPSMLPPTLHPPAPSTAPSTVLSVAKKLDYAPSVASVDSGFSSAPSIVLSSDDKPTSTARLRAEECKTIAPLVIQSDLDFVLQKLNNTPMNSPSADSIESVRTRKKKQRSTVSPMRLNTRLMDLKLLAEAADVVEGRSRSSSIDREGSSQPEPKILQPSSLRVLPKKRIVNNVVSDGTHKYSVRIDYFAGTAQIDRKLTVPRTKKLRPEDEPAPIIAHLYNQGKREFKLALKDGKPDWSKMASLASKPPLTPMTPILPGKSSRSQSPTELERSKTSAVPRRLFRKPFLMPEIPERDISKEGSPATSDSGRSLRIEQPVTRREQSVTSTTTTSTESRQLDSDEDIDIEIIDPADSDVEEDKLHIVTDDEDSVLGEASLELNDYLDDAKKQDEPLDLSMPKVIQADPVVGHPQIKVEARTESPYGMNTQKDWEILDWDTPGCSQSPGISLEDLTLLKISHDDSPAPEDLTAKGPELPIDQLQKLTFKTEDIVIPKPKTIAPKLKAKKPKKFATPCRPKDKYIRRQSTRFAEIMTEDEPPEIVTDLTNHLENMDSVRSAVEAAERERKRMFTTVACDSVVRQEARDRSRRLIAPKIAKRSKSADRWLGRTIYKHFGEFWVLGLARLAQPKVKKVPKKNQFEQVSRCNTPATIAPWDDDYQNCIQEEELPPPPQQLVFPVHESFRQAEQSAIRNPATVWATYHQETPEDRNTKKPAGPSFFRNRRNRRH